MGEGGREWKGGVRFGRVAVFGEGGKENKLCRVGRKKKVRPKFYILHLPFRNEILRLASLTQDDRDEANIFQSIQNFTLYILHFTF